MLGFQLVLGTLREDGNVEMETSYMYSSPALLCEIHAVGNPHKCLLLTDEQFIINIDIYIFISHLILLLLIILYNIKKADNIAPQ